MDHLGRRGDVDDDDQRHNTGATFTRRRVKFGVLPVRGNNGQRTIPSRAEIWAYRFRGKPMAWPHCCEVAAKRSTSEDTPGFRTEMIPFSMSRAGCPNLHLPPPLLVLQQVVVSHWPSRAHTRSILR